MCKSILKKICGESYFVIYVLVFLYICKFYPILPHEISLDASWNSSISEAVSRKFIFGTNLIFTYGPLGPIFTNQFSPLVDVKLFLWSFYCATAFFITFVRFARSSENKILVILLPILIVSFRFNLDSLYIFYGTLLIFTLLKDYEVESGVALKNKYPKIEVILFGLQVGVLGLFPLIKGSFFVTTIYSALLLLWVTYKKKLRLHLILIIILPLSIFIFAWLSLDQPFFGIKNYFENLVQIISGYSDSMSLTGKSFETISYLLISLIVLTILSYKNPNKDFFIIKILSLTLFLFVSFKEGFVRHDSHALTAADSIFLAVLLLHITLNERIYYILLFVTIIFWSSVHKHYENTYRFSIIENFKGVINNAYNGFKIRLYSYNSLKDSYLKAQKKLALDCQIPEILTGTVDIYSFNQGCLIAKGYNWKPRPVFQSYSVYTQNLQNKNVVFLNSSNAPENILFKIEPIDNRLPSLEDGLSWPVLISKYDLLRFDKGYALFKNNNNYYFNSHYNLIYSGSGHLNNFIKLNSKENIYAEIYLEPNFFGKLFELIYKLPQINIELFLNYSDQPIKYRFIPSAAKNKFLLSPLIKNTQDFVLYSEKDNIFSIGNKVNSFRLTFDEKWASFLWNKNFNFKFYNIDIRKSNWISSGLFSKQVNIEYNEAKKTQFFCEGSVDKINNTSPVPRKVNINSHLSVNGWSAVSTKDGIIPDETFITVLQNQKKPIFFSTNIDSRPDVGIFFKNKKLNNCGYKALINVKNFDSSFKLGIAQKYNNKLILCEPFRDVYLF